MTRHNLIKQTVSSIRAMDLFEKTGFYNIPIRTDAPQVPGSYAIDADRFDNVLRWLKTSTENLECFLRDLSAEKIHLDYEDLVADPEGAMASVCGFLGVEPAPFKVKTRKITSDNLSESVANYWELRTRYLDTPYGDMF